MSDFQKPVPVDSEVNWDKTRVIISKTDTFGTILDVNDVFCDVSGYSKDELVKQPHNVIRHPDMPKAIFKVMWESLKNGENFYGIVKNLAKSGKYYWVLTDFNVVKDKNGSVVNYEARRLSVPDELIANEIAPLYNRIMKLEEFYGADGGQNYLNGFLEKEDKSYIEYIHYVVNKYTHPESFEDKKMSVEESRSFLRKLFG